MNSSSFASLFEHEDSTIIPPPPLKKPRRQDSKTQSIPLSSITTSQSHQDRRHQFTEPGTEASIQDITASQSHPLTPNELEMSHSTHDLGAEPTDVVQSVWHPYMNRYRMVAACLYTLSSGLNDSATGALLIYIESQYDIGYAVVSIIFISNALGFVLAATFTNSMTLWLGRSKTLMVSYLLLVIAYGLLVITPPFPVVVLSFFITGVGLAISLTINIVFTTTLKNGTVMNGIFQGTYGIGGSIGPLIGTSIVSHGLPWSRFYAMCLGLAAFNLFFSGWAYRNYEEDAPTLAERVDSYEAHGTTRWAAFKKILSNKIAVLGAAFVFAYQGSEVAISGWIISFLVNYRGGDPSKVGYVTSGFWAGVTLGRFTISHLGTKIGERNLVFGLTAGALGLQILIWFLPSIVGDAIAIAVAGVFLGPIYPSASQIFIRLIPRKDQLTTMAFIASIGSSGGAFVPFLTGILAQQVGTYVLHPICISLFIAMTGAWWLMPKVSRRSE